MIKQIDYFLDRITMYRLILYVLIVFTVVAVGYSLAGIIAFSPINLIASTLFLVAVGWITNKIFAYVLKAPTNIESVYVTALILALIITPAQSIHGYIFLGWAAVLAMASKYILAINNKHIFNPAAIAVVLTAYGINQSASWWVGTSWMMPWVLVGGLLIVRKIRREDFIFSFFITTFLVVVGLTVFQRGDVLNTIKVMFFSSSLFFFAFIMLTEPLTTPPTKKLQMIYAASSLV